MCSAVFNMSTLSGARMDLPIQLLCEDGIIEGIVMATGSNMTCVLYNVEVCYTSITHREDSHLDWVGSR